MQGLSRALFEAGRVQQEQVTSLDWVTYPILRFKDAPKVTIHGLTRTDVPDPSGPARARPARASRALAAGRRRGRQRVLRRHGRPHPRGADDARPRPRRRSRRPAS